MVLAPVVRYATDLNSAGCACTTLGNSIHVDDHRLPLMVVVRPPLLDDHIHSANQVIN